jgi:putative FmdB family regulatory protein
MPLYEYQCEACGRRFEVIQKMSDSPVQVCTICAKGPVRQLLSSPAIQFKGSGWYITDYAKKGSSTESADSSKGETKKDDTKKSDASTSDTSKKTDTAASTPASTPAASKD